MVLVPEQIDRFNRDGFLALETLLPPAPLDAVWAEYEALLDEVAQTLWAEGKLKDRYQGLAFGPRYTALINDFPDLHFYLNISLPLLNDPAERRANPYRVHAGPAVFGLITHPALLDVIESLLGPEIASNPVQQNRMKPPSQGLRGQNALHSNVGQTTWHQDIVSVLPEADETKMITAWVALTDAGIENGCLSAVPQSHRKGPRIHCANGKLASEPTVPDALMVGEDEVPLPIKRGGVVLFNKLNVHRALPNVSNQLRWSMDLRYSEAGKPTGRPAYPSFIARSRAHPESELCDPKVYAANWATARQALLTEAYAGPVFEDRTGTNSAFC